MTTILYLQLTKWTIILGAVCWLILYIVYFFRLPKAVIVVSQTLHGLAYVFFIIAGQIYVSKVAPQEIAGSAQSLIMLATNGVGLFLGTRLAGVSMDRFREQGSFNWSKIFLIPLLITFSGVMALIFVF